MSSASLADGATVLIVDDTPVSLGVVVEALEGAGFRVSVAEGGEEAMRRAALIQPDLILLDVMMPELDGFEVCRCLKASAATADIPVIFMTALAEASDKLAGFSAGAVDYVTKPLQIEEIVARVSAHVRLRVMQRQLETQNEELRRYREELELRVAERTADLGASNRLLRQEVDERQRMAQALSASEQQFRTVAENSPDIIARYDRKCRRLYVSPAFERLGGISAQGLIGKTPLEFQVNVPLVSAAFQAHIRAVLQSGAAREFDLEWHTPDGGQLSLAIRAVPEFGCNGRVASVLTIARDITERKRAEAALRESERRYRDIFNHVSDGMYMVEVTEDGRFRNLEYNPAMIRSMGMPPEQIIGKFIDEAEPRDATIAQLRRCMEAGTTTHEDIEIDLPSGHRYYSSSFVPLRAPGGRIYRIVAISRDVTAQKRRAWLEHTRLQMLEELAAGAPLDGVLGLVVAYVELTNPDFLCSIMLVDEEGKHLRSGPAPSLPADYVAVVDGMPIGEGVGSCGTAAWRNETVIAEDVRTHPCWAPYKHLALKAGLLACWSEPILDSHGWVAGTFGIYRREPGGPSAEDLETVREASHLAALAIERKRNEAVLHRREQEFRTLVENIPDFVLRLDLQARYLFVSPALTKAFGVPSEHFIGREVADVSLSGDLVGDLQMREAVLLSAREGVPAMLTMTIAHRSGDRVFDILYVPERDELGKVVSVLGVARDITSLQSAHHELQKKEALLRSLIDSIPDLIIFKDLDSVYLGFNKAFAAYCGRSEAEMLGKNDYDFAPREVADFYRDNDRAMLESGEARHNDEWIEYPDGRRVLLDTLKTPLYGANGNVIGVIGISRDITERKRMQDEIAVREQEFRTLVENAPDAVVRYDRECRRIYVNRAYEAISAIRREDVLGTTPLDFWRLPVPADEYMTMLRHIMATGEEETLTFETIVDGNLHCRSIRLVPEYGQDGQAVSVLSITRDITDIKRMETLLRKSEIEFRTLAENSPDMIVRYDPDCRRIYLNPAYERYTGTRLEEAWNRTPHEVVWKPLIPKEEYMARLQRVMKTGEPDQILLEWYLPDGSLTSHLMQTVAEYDNEGRPVGVLVIGHNISQLKAVERRLEESRAELRALTVRREEAREGERKRIAGEIHDELGQLLSVLRLNATTLDFRFGNENRDLREKVQKMVGTVDQAIAVVRSIASRLRPAVIASGTVPAVEWLVQEFTESTGIVCKLFVESDDIALDEDRSMALFRITQESLTNVLRHSGADSVEIFLRYVDDACEMTVRDNGKGFDLARAGRHNTFGLVGMRERALMLGGEMEIVTSPGSGTTLKLRVPVGMGLPLSS